MPAAPPQDVETGPADSVTDPEQVPVSAHRTNPERTVFVENGNSDGWIATDLAIELER
jgi:hypothetical protein